MASQDILSAVECYYTRPIKALEYYFMRISELMGWVTGQASGYTYQDQDKGPLMTQVPRVPRTGTSERQYRRIAPP